MREHDWTQTPLPLHLRQIESARAAQRLRMRSQGTPWGVASAALGTAALTGQFVGAGPLAAALFAVALGLLSICLVTSLRP